MKNIIVMNSHKPLGRYIHAASPRWTFDWPFHLGVILTIVLPELIFGAYFGNSSIAVFGLCAMLGTGIGLDKYRNPPLRMPPCAPAIVISPSIERDHRWERAA